MFDITKNMKQEEMPQLINYFFSIIIFLGSLVLIYTWRIEPPWSYLVIPFAIPFLVIQIKALIHRNKKPSKDNAVDAIDRDIKAFR